MNYLIIASAIYSILSSTAFAEENVKLTRENTKGDTTFVAKGWPSALKIVGTAGAPVGEIKLDKYKIVGSTFEIDLNEFDTKLSLRNEHMKNNYLETQKFPITKLRVSELLLDLKKNNESVPFSGTLNLHGVSKPVSGVVETKLTDSDVAVLAKFSIKTSEFDIKQVDYMGIKVAETIDITVSFSLEKKTLNISE
jgi:polyisoprenoid-binding protein YceI